MESNMNRTKPSRFKALVSAFALGSSLCFAHTSAWAVCSGDTVINSNQTTTQFITSDLCSFTVQNNSLIYTSGINNYGGIVNSTRTIISLSNYGSIASYGIGAPGISNILGTITSLKNTGTIDVLVSNNAIFNDYGTITTLTNTGTISAPNANGAGISNTGAIGTLNNQQGGSNPLTYSGQLPTNYNIIVGSSTNYGKLSVTSPTNASGTSGITFNIYGNTGTTEVSGVSSSTLAAGTYSGVITGLSASNIVSSSRSGTFTNGLSWQLVANGNVNTSTTWDLVVTAPQATLLLVSTPNNITVNGTSTLSTTGGSGSGNVTYAWVSGPCSLSGSTLTGTGVGNCVVTATKAADNSYSATSVELTVAVSLATQTYLVLAASSDSITVNSTSTLSSTGGSGSGNLTYRVLNGPCSVSGATLTANGVGICLVIAQKDTDGTYAIATSSPLSIFTAVAPGIQVTGGSSFGTATVSAAAGAAFINLMAGRFTTVSNPPAGKTFPYGLFEFTAQTTPGGSVTVTVTYAQALPSYARYMKLINGNWIDWTNQVTVSGNTATYTITDNGAGDSNPAAGVITDPFGPVIDMEVAQIPTLSEWAMILLVSLMGMWVFVTQRMSKRKATLQARQR
jgi:hypothetical protein